MAKRVCCVVASRANYGRLLSVMRAVRDHPALELQLIVAASALLDRYGGDSLLATIEREFTINERIYTHVEGDTPGCMALTEGLFTVQLVNVFERLKPDFVLCHGDRHEVLAIAKTAAYCNLVVAHTEGGEVTGSIDDKVRNAITQLADIHFPVTWQAAMRVKAMRPDATVHVVGSTALDSLACEDLDRLPDIRGVGATLDPHKPYLVVLAHAVTTEYGEAWAQAETLIEAVKRLHMPTAWLWPNADAGGEAISGAIRRWREREHPDYVCMVKNLPPVEYARLLNHCACLIGNTSSGIKEGAFMGVPYTLIGSRQKGRETGGNVVHVGWSAEQIVGVTKWHVEQGKLPRDLRFGDGTAGRQIARILAEV
jgi:UDP-hydrolysing UDP-N-acetyl-D-glucosamine 2-epimerase